MKYRLPRCSCTLTLSNFQKTSLFSNMRGKVAKYLNSSIQLNSLSNGAEKRRVLWTFTQCWIKPSKLHSSNYNEMQLESPKMPKPRHQITLTNALNIGGQNPELHFSVSCDFNLAEQTVTSNAQLYIYIYVNKISMKVSLLTTSFSFNELTLV